jgi:hypothetical protein
MIILAAFETRVARWYIFKPKFQIWVNFGGFGNGRCCYILWTFGLFYGQIVCYMDIWYIYGKLVLLFPFWYIVPRKIWQPCSKQGRDIDFGRTWNWVSENTKQYYNTNTKLFTFSILFHFPLAEEKILKPDFDASRLSKYKKSTFKVSLWRF